MQKRHEAKYDQPVVMDKPARHRELESIKVPGEEGYYKAYEDGKEFLIPKTNLDAMKELVNYKMRRKGESVFVRAPDPQREKKQLQQFQEKLENLAVKMDEYDEVVLKPLQKDSVKYKRSTVLKEIDPTFKMSKISGVDRGVSTLRAKSLSLQSVSESDEEYERVTKFKLSDRDVSSLMTKSQSRKTKSLSLKSVSESDEEYERGTKFKLSDRGVSSLKTKSSQSRKTKSLSLKSVSESDDEEYERGTKLKMSDRGVSSLKAKSLSRKTKSLSLKSVSESDEEPLRGIQSMSDEIMLQSFTVPDINSVKFLVSGHFRDNKKPIFIIRQYRGSSVIGRKNADFSSSKTEEDVDILISGKFYKKTILDESTDKPTTMRFKHRKKILIDSRSTVLEDGFIDLFPASTFDVVVGGMFVKTPSSPHYTPLVSIAVKRSMRSTYGLGDRSRSSDSRGMVVAMSTPVIKNPFVSDLRKTHSAPKNRFHNRQEVPSVAREPQGFKNLLARIDEGEEVFECPPSPKPKSRDSSRSSTSTQKSFIKTIDEQRKNFIFPKMFNLDSFLLFKKELPMLKNETKFKKSSKTPNRKDVKPIDDVAKPEYVSLPSTSQSKTPSNTEEDQRVSLVVPKPKVDEVNRNPKKPGLFIRIFKKLFSR